VYTDGELIHNSNALGELARAGIGQLRDTQKLNKSSDSIVIRAHGVTPARRKLLNSLCGRVVDATCPKVLRIARLMEKYSAGGYHPVLIGDGAHPEVIGLCGYASGGNITVLSSVEEALDLKISAARIVVLSQTTFERDLFQKIAGVICERFGNVAVENTLCSATVNRQREILRFIENGCDCILVVGSEFSRNTKSLRDTAEGNGCRALIVEHAGDKTIAEAQNYSRIGVISGTSTNYEDVKGVYEKLLSLVSE
jgi:4-hydroxy-3-methylbut-2-enyl diphosphate reductase